MGLKASRIRVPGLAGHDGPAAAALCTRAAAGDQGAWDEIVERYAPMVWPICTRFRLSDRELEDVAQRVWLLLVEQLGNLPDPAALAGWLAATTWRECRRVLTAARGPEPPEPPDAAATGEAVIMAERIRESSARLGLAETGGNRPGGDPGA
jgi:DNA-directed RNA polymerase specialized sigma24 family protein